MIGCPEPCIVTVRGGEAMWCRENIHRCTNCRVRILTEQKELQLAELRALEQTKAVVRDKAGALGERLQSCHDNQELILHRWVGEEAYISSLCESDLGFCQLMFEVLLYVHKNHRLIRNRSQGRPPRLSHSPIAMFLSDALISFIGGCCAIGLVGWLFKFVIELFPKSWWQGPKFQVVRKERDYIPNSTLSPPEWLLH